MTEITEKKEISRQSSNPQNPTICFRIEGGKGYKGRNRKFDGFQVPKGQSYEDFKEAVIKSKLSKSGYIRSKIFSDGNSIDTDILRKMILPFAEQGMDIYFTEIEIERIQTIYGEEK